MKSNMEPPSLQLPMQPPELHITTYQPPVIQQPPPPSNEQFENFYIGFDKYEYEVYELKHLYQEFFNIELSIYSFARLKIIRTFYKNKSYKKHEKNHNLS